MVYQVPGTVYHNFTHAFHILHLLYSVPKLLLLCYSPFLALSILLFMKMYNFFPPNSQKPKILFDFFFLLHDGIII